MTKSTFKLKIVPKSSHTLKKYWPLKLPFSAHFLLLMRKVLQEIYYLMISSLKKLYYPSPVLSHNALTREVCKTLVTFFSIWTIFQSTMRKLKTFYSIQEPQKSGKRKEEGRKSHLGGKFPGQFTRQRDLRSTDKTFIDTHMKISISISFIFHISQIWLLGIALISLRFWNCIKLSPEGKS